jgi:CheY-like chemotaxis protein
VDIGALIVDDQDDIRLLMRIIVGAAGGGLFVKGEAASGQQALDRLDEVDPDVVLIDEMMPGMSGVETAVRILERRPSQAIVMCTAHVDAHLLERARAAGIERCIEKEAFEQVPDALRAAVRTRRG